MTLHTEILAFQSYNIIAIKQILSHDLSALHKLLSKLLQQTLSNGELLKNLL